MTHKMHFLLLIALKHSGPYETGCGMLGEECQGISDEYVTVRGDRFEATPVAKRVTCGRCHRSKHFPMLASTVTSQERA